MFRESFEKAPCRALWRKNAAIAGKRDATTVATIGGINDRQICNTNTTRDPTRILKRAVFSE